MEAKLREQRCSALADEPFDVVVVGGGISGAAVFARLARSGYRVLLIDKGDFGSFTSQQSAMMIWGGLLYLTRLDFRTVYNLSRDRDQLIKRYPHEVRSQYYRYLPLKSGWQMRPLVKGLFDFYRLLGGFHRRPNRIEQHFSEQDLVLMSRYRGSVAYEEAMLTTSDTRFVLDMIRSHDSETSIPLNYVSLESGDYTPSERLWHLTLQDQFATGEIDISARLVVNAAGPHADRVNSNFNIQSPYKHIFSKGVFLSFERPHGHETPLIFELGQNRDVLTFIPWGPVSYWGPTEVAAPDLTGVAEPTQEEIDFLIEQANCTLNHRVTQKEIIAYRSGVRPLVVKADYHADRYPLELSRHHRVHVEHQRHWLTVYGGKFTSSHGMSERVEQQVAALIGSPLHPPLQPTMPTAVTNDTTFPGLEGRFPSIAHCIEHEYCLTISDYLRRRTNIAQWVARNGLGNSSENLPYITQLADQLPNSTNQPSSLSLHHFISETHRIFDTIQGVGKERKT